MMKMKHRGSKGGGSLPSGGGHKGNTVVEGAHYDKLGGNMKSAFRTSMPISINIKGGGRK